MRAFDSSKLVLWAAIALCSLAVPSHLNAQAQSQILPRITQEVNESSLVTLRGTVSPLANAQNDAGAASPDLRLERMQLVLQRSPGQEADLQQLIADMHTPGTANYHKWLTPTQFGNQFGPSDQDIQAIENWVESHGFQVGTLNPGKGSLEISGTVGQLQDAFHTSIHKYIVDGQPHFANANEPQIPAALAPVLKGFVSLNNFPVHRMSRYLGKATYDPTTGQATPQWTNPSGSSPLGYDLVLSPKDFYVQYDLNPLLNAGTNGAGQTIAIINDANINLNVVNNFRTLFGLPANPPQVIIDGNDPGIDGINNPTGPNYDSIEAYLDVEWSGAIAPNANIDFVIGADTAIESGLILAAERAIFSNLAPVMSLSFGACEQSLGSGNSFLNTLWEQAAAEGITVLV
ncbi:MAG TPA: protease pro-enzyme activation domain-containing protein, partial [Acidobacteriaceae bacterium]|nr:protease pro-enzyme activation domain-containing protein [Acidobacteriaceae bacterium]